jgi:hypothetical protein
MQAHHPPPSPYSAWTRPITEEGRSGSGDGCAVHLGKVEQRCLGRCVVQSGLSKHPLPAHHAQRLQCGAQDGIAIHWGPPAQGAGQPRSLFQLAQAVAKPASHL